MHRDVARRTTGSRPADVKIDNKRSVLQHVYLRGTSSKPEACQAAGLSRPTASNLIDELIDSGVLRKTTLGAPSDTGGKRPQLFGFNDDAGWAIGIDADGQAVHGAAANLRLASQAVHVQPVNAGPDGTSPPERVGEAVADTARVLIDAARNAGRPVIGIGVSLPGEGNAAPAGQGAADRESTGRESTGRESTGQESTGQESTGQGSTGRESTGRGTDAVEQAASEALVSLGLPVLMAPRIHNAAVAETWFGCGITSQRTSFMVVDTHDGLSTSLVHADGETPINAAYSMAALGHTTVNLDGPRCWCGNRGCWELYASERAFRQAIKRGAALWHLPSALASDLRAGSAPAVSEVAAHLRKGDEFARTQVETYADRLAIGLVNVVNAFGLGVVVLHGGLRPLGQSFLELVARHVRDVALQPAAAEFGVMFSPLPDNVPLMAAAAVIRDALEGTTLISALAANAQAAKENAR